MYLDAAVNRKQTVVRSIFSASLMAAFRFHAIVKHILIRHRRKGVLNVRFLAHKAIKSCCVKMIGHVRNVRRRKMLRISLSSTEISWLFFEAFCRKLGKHLSLYTSLLPDVRQFREECGQMLPPIQLARLRQCIGKGIPRPFRRMRDSVT